MNFFRVIQMIRAGMPVFQSIRKAYRDTTGGSKGQDASYFSKYFSKVMGENNLGAPPLTPSTALQILNIEKDPEQVQPRLILQRYYTLFKKNDPKVGGTTYLQSKVYAAKELLMEKFPDKIEQEELFYKEVVEPEQKAEEEAAKAEGEAATKEAAKGQQGDKEKGEKQSK